MIQVLSQSVRLLCDKITPPSTNHHLRLKLCTRTE